MARMALVVLMARMALVVPMVPMVRQPPRHERGAGKGGERDVPVEATGIA